MPPKTATKTAGKTAAKTAEKGLEQPTLDNVLHRYIRMHNDLLHPTSAEDRVREEVLNTFQHLVIKRVQGTDGVRLYGSVPIGIDLPTADLDISIIAPGVVKKQDQAKMLRRVADIAKDVLMPSIEGRYNAKVPVVVAETIPALGGFGIDITVNNRSGLDCVEIIKDYMSKMPALRPLVLVLKSFLTQRGLNNPSNGGLGSYSLTCMVISFLQINPVNRPQEYLTQPMESRSLGTLLIDFLIYYGVDFPYDISFISIKDGKLLPKTSQTKWIKAPNPPMLKISIECMITPEHDVGAPTTMMGFIKNQFKAAAVALLETATLDSNLLEPIVSVNHRSIVLARQRLNQAALGLYIRNHTRTNPPLYAAPQQRRQKPFNSHNFAARMQHPLPPKPAPYPQRTMEDNQGHSVGKPRKNTRR